MTDLNKPVRRRSNAFKRDRSKLRRIVVTIYPGDYLGLRLEKCRQEETLPLTAAYDVAVKMRVAAERADRAAAKKMRRF